MTCEEAIKIIEEYCDNGTHDFAHDALQMAVKALEQCGNTVDLFNLTEEERQQNQWNTHNLDLMRMTTSSTTIAKG